MADTIECLLGRVAKPRVDELDETLLVEGLAAKMFAKPPPSIALGRYRVLQCVGAGGGGKVYKGHDPELDRPVAIKILALDGDRDLYLERVRREGQMLARLNHPRVVQVFDVIAPETGGDVAVIMQWIDGCPLGRWLRAKPRHPSQVIAVLIEAGEGLAAAHACGVVHRDFKPSNILIDRDGRVTVLDFGLADVEPGVLATDSEAGATFAGTPAYMAPEQWLGKIADVRSDQYSFCAALFEASISGMAATPLAAMKQPSECPEKTFCTALRRASRTLLQ